MRSRGSERWFALRAAGFVIAAIAADVVLTTCGPAPPTRPSPVTVSVKVTSAGVSPAALRAPRAFVEFVNEDPAPHDIRSDVHPTHAICPELNVGVIEPGHRVSLLVPLESGRNCGYHDDTRVGDLRFAGTITID